MVGAGEEDGENEGAEVRWWRLSADFWLDSFRLYVNTKVRIQASATNRRHCSFLVLFY